MPHTRLCIITFARLLLPSLLLLFTSTNLNAAPSNSNISQSRLKKPASGKNSQLLREQNNMRICRAFSPENIQTPRISVTKIKQSSALKGGEYKVEGIIDGVCLKEAGLYVNGSRIVKFKLSTTPTYKRYDFQL